MFPHDLPRTLIVTESVLAVGCQVVVSDVFGGGRGIITELRDLFRVFGGGKL